MDLFDILGLHVGCGVLPTEQGLIASLTRKKSHLGGLLGWRSHGSVVSTACSNSLVSLNSRRTNREEEVKKPHITTITAALGTEEKKGYNNHSQRRSEGVIKKGKHSLHSHTEESFSVTWSLLFLWFYANLPPVPNPLKLFWNLSLWLGSHSSVRVCLTLHFYDSMCVCDTECMKDWDKTMGFFSNYRWVEKNTYKLWTVYLSYTYTQVLFHTSQLLKTTSAFAEIRSICVL